MLRLREGRASRPLPLPLVAGAIGKVITDGGKEREGMVFGGDLRTRWGSRNKELNEGCYVVEWSRSQAHVGGSKGNVTLIQGGMKENVKNQSCTTQLRYSYSCVQDDPDQEVYATRGRNQSWPKEGEELVINTRDIT